MKLLWLTDKARSSISHLREKGVSLVQNLDDILVVASSPNRKKEHMKLVAQHLQTLGFLTQQEVCVWTYSGDRVPWLYGRFSPDEDFPAYTDNEEYNEGMQESY